MSLHGRLFARFYDGQMSKVEAGGLRARREDLLAAAKGRVIEIGGGTGANLPLYGADLESLTVTEPEPAMLKRLEKRAREHAPDALVLRAPAEDLPFDDDSFDVAVSTLVLCGVNDQPRALRELHRVLRPGGQLLFIEHVRCGDPKKARRQDRMNGLNRLIAGCDCNRSTIEGIGANGFDVTVTEQIAPDKVPSFLHPWVIGTARATVDQHHRNTTEGAQR
jgi:ubiquinone/menaquinone biosynthesis C-methylase UbiE